MPQQSPKPDIVSQAESALSSAIDALVSGVSEARLQAGKRPVDAPLENLDDAAADMATQMMIDILQAPARQTRPNLIPRERGGSIVKLRDGTFRPTPIQRLATNVGGEMTLPNSARAIVHTHPPGDREFSGIDKLMSRSLVRGGRGTPSFMAPFENRVSPDLFRFNPETGETEEVLHQIPMGRITQFYLDQLRKSGLAGK